MFTVFDCNNHDISHILYCALPPRFPQIIVQCTVQLEFGDIHMIELHPATVLLTFAFGVSGGRFKKQAKQGQAKSRASLLRSSVHSVASTFLSHIVKTSTIIAFHNA